MITKFLYQTDEKNKRVLTGIVENDEKELFDPLKEYPMVLDHNYQAGSGETVTYNYGKLYYGVFSDGEVFKYVNVNDYMLKVKLSASDNVVFASALSKEMMSVILENLDYFNEEMDVEYIDSGLSLGKNNQYSDVFDGWFRKVTDDVYCMFNNMGKKPLFIGMENGQYTLVDDFKLAQRVYKKEVRNLLITHEFITTEDSKKSVSFSHYNIFFDGHHYLFGGENSFQVCLENDVLSIERNVVPTTEYRLINDETRAGTLKNMCYLFKTAYLNKKAYFMANGKYLRETSKLTYELTDNSALATPIEFRIIDALKQAFFLYIENCPFKVTHEENYRYFLYQKEDNYYELSSEVKEGKSILVQEEDYRKYKNSFADGVKNQSGYILLSNQSYIKLNYIDNFNFQLQYVPSGFDASIFNLQQAEALAKVLSGSFMKKEISPIFNCDKLYRISSSNRKDSMEESYLSFLDEVSKSKIRFNLYPDLTQMKTESDKNAIEFLKLLYPKCVMDSKMIFTNIFKNSPYVKKVLIVGGSSNCDLIGLNLASNELQYSVDVTTLESIKWGYYPPCCLNEKVHYQGSYRLTFSSLPKSFVEQFDLIYFGKNYRETSEELKEMLIQLKTLNKNLLFAHTNLCGLGEFKDSFSEAFKSLVSVTKKYINVDKQAYIGFVPESKIEEISFDFPIVSKTISYHSLLKLQKNEYLDLYKKNK